MALTYCVRGTIAIPGRAGSLGRASAAAATRLSLLMSDKLLDHEAGALQIGATDSGMVRLIVTTHSDVVELDFEPSEALEIAEEIRSAAARIQKDV